MSFSMVFAADLVPTASNEQYFISGDVRHLFGDEMLSFLSAADFRCFNLETPLTESTDTALYPGPWLRAKPQTVHALAELRPSLLTLGNNHILDQGEQGCLDTLRTLEEAGIPYTGAGRNRDEAQKPFVLPTPEGTLGIYNCTEYEFAAAAPEHAGADPYDPLCSFDAVRDLKQACDAVVVLFHGGKEFYRYPSPLLRRICRKFAECGADLVICQHSHCIGCAEDYLGARLVYGQGNFLFDRKENEYKKTGMFVTCRLEAGRLLSVEYVPFVKQGECVRPADGETAARILREMEARGKQIQEPGFVEASYRQLAEREYPVYLRKILSGKKLVRLLDRLTRGRYTAGYYSRRGALAFLNVISPENHAELFQQGLRIKGGR